MEEKYLVFGFAVIAIIYILLRIMPEISWGDSKVEKAQMKCVEIAWKLKCSSVHKTGDPEAFQKFDCFWKLVEEHDFNTESLSITSFMEVLHHACTAFEKHFPNDALQKCQSETYFTSMSTKIAAYLSKQKFEVLCKL